MTPQDHINEATRLLLDAGSHGVDGGYDQTRVAAAQVHVAIAMYLRMEPAVDVITEPVQELVVHQHYERVNPAGAPLP